MKTTLYRCLLVAAFFNFNNFSQAQTIVNDPDFLTGTGFDTQNAAVREIIRQPDGKLLVGGWFETYNGTAVKSLCRLNENGTIDSTFHFNNSYATVVAMALQADGKVIVAGNFSEWNGVAQGSITRLNTDGSIDTTFLSGDGFEHSAGFWAPYVLDAGIQSDGKIIVTGQFGGYDGTTRHNFIRLNSDGTVDPTYDPGQYVDYQNTMSQGVAPYTIAFQPDGKLLVGGVFDSYGSVELGGLMRLNTDGSLDSAFAEGLTFSMDPYYGTPFIQAIEVLADGKLLVGGVFDEVNGETHYSMARLTSDGDLDNTFVTSSNFISANSNRAQVALFHLQDDGKLIIAGRFERYDGNVTMDLMRLMPDGSFDYGFAVEDLSSPQSFDRVNDIEVLSNSSIIVGGDFTSVQGESKNHLTRLNICGSFSVTEALSCTDFVWDADNSTYTESGIYYAQLTNSNGCDSILFLQLTIPIQPDVPAICIVGVDSLTNGNRIVWEKPLSPAIDSFYVYKETTVADVYERIGATDYNEAGVWLDESADPAVQAYRYKISLLDSCGRETDLSPEAHQTVHLTINQGMGSTWNLIWTPYQGISVPTYTIYRGTNAGNMSFLAAVSGNMSTYSDLNAPDSVCYQVVFVNPNECDPSKSIDYSVSHSNLASNHVLSVNESGKIAFSLFPNPATDELTIQLPVSDGTVSIYSPVGTKVLEQPIDNQQTVLNIGQLASGMYTLVVNSGHQLSAQRFVKK